MELGAGVELATAMAPHLFLPLACAANVVKVYHYWFSLVSFMHSWHINFVTHLVYFQNVAAVTSTSTRTPIYKAFAKGENIGDVTAKGECVGNIADLVCLPS